MPSDDLFFITGVEEDEEVARINHPVVAIEDRRPSEISYQPSPTPEIEPAPLINEDISELRAMIRRTKARLTEQRTQLNGFCNAVAEMKDGRYRCKSSMSQKSSNQRAKQAKALPARAVTSLGMVDERSAFALADQLQEICPMRAEIDRRLARKNIREGVLRSDKTLARVPSNSSVNCLQDAARNIKPPKSVMASGDSPKLADRTRASRAISTRGVRDPLRAQCPMLPRPRSSRKPKKPL